MCSTGNGVAGEGSGVLSRTGAVGGTFMSAANAAAAKGPQALLAFVGAQMPGL